MIDPRHEQEILLPRGISATDAEQYRVRSVEAADDVFPPRYAVGSGLIFEWHSPLSGVVLQFRPDEPALNDNGTPVKYVFPAGTTMVLNKLRDPGTGPVLLCEGTMQSIAAAVYAPQEYAVYGMSGCWSWRSGDTTVATPDLMVVEDRDVVVALDADAATNLDVYNAGIALQAALENEGATSVRFLRLEGQGKKAGLDDVLGARPVEKRASFLARLIERAEEKPAKTKPPKKARTGGGVQVVASAGRPVVSVNDDRLTVINDLTRALQQKWDGDVLFEYGGILAKRTDAAVQPVTEGVFADLVAQAALCVTVTSKGDMLPGWPDDKSMRSVLSRAGQFAPLDRVSRIPFVRTDGTVCQTPGYDQASRAYLVLDDEVQKITVPDEPSEDDVRSAVKLLTDEWLGDLFSIMPEAEDRANCLAMMLTPMIRGLVPLAPMAVVDGLQMGVGKNLLADLLAILTTGSPAKPLLYNREDEENRKVITAEFRAGSDLLVFDEAHVIEGRALAKALTGLTYSDRILGVSNMVEFPNRVTWVALGNNVSINGDLSRRVYRIRLAPSVANPQDRDVSSYRHPDIKGWTREHRHELVAAGLTLVRAWFNAGAQHNVNGRRFGSFEQWGGMVGGILDNAGVPGFLESLAEWRSETDYETSFWAAHLEWLRERFGDKDFTVGDVVTAMRRSNGPVEHPPRLEDHAVVGYNRLLGLAYKKVRNRIIQGLRLVKTHESAGHSSRWAVTSPGGEKELVTLVPPSATRGDFSPQYVHVDVRRSENAPAAREEGSHTTVTSYPSYPAYPPMDGDDPLASLLPLAVDVPPAECLDCGATEEVVPGAHWTACRACTPRTFDTRT